VASFQIKTDSVTMTENRALVTINFSDDDFGLQVARTG
jgi:hypothetical protein